MSIIRDLTIPMMGSVENARLLQWYVAEGDAFVAGDVLYELETDKTVTEITAEEDGILVRRLGEEGADFKMGDCVGWQAPAGSLPEAIQQGVALREGNGPQPAAAAVALATSVTALESSTTAATTEVEPGEMLMGGVMAKTSPRSRKLAREYGIDITTVTATGPRGRVTGEDVLRVAAKRKRLPVAAGPEANVVPQKAPVPTVEPGAEVAAAGTSLPSPAQRPVALTNKPAGTRVRHSLRRKTIASNMVCAKREMPHLTADMDIDLSALMALRKRFKASGQQPPSILAYFACNASRLLQEHKSLNATFGEDEMVLWNSVNLNIAVDTDEGLVVPVIRDAQLLTAAEMSTRIAGLAEAARQRALQPEEMAGGTFTISNPGALGPVVRAEAVLNGDQVALMGMPGIVQKPVAVALPDGSYAVQVRPILRLGITFDHRALDGGPVIRFLNALKFAIESLA
ncbi:2-oxo acid dehydrogenase subunit E2 [Pseudomaricurvus alcaniphilus]|uniref:dihydrolipoamide acetyltransferase family protein n=1 Tax=Pseudomaricurvus alcaniphilus TaxID=1166482 RepID=UPI00140B5998|nr:dihydrolipoamide acetyltransferase family protein [Pseudomaricurvus alcaniphilus]NHN36830.1 2-oxo acid dehydrogenase subunit E2 [Pseudomaricurvus alcaniphilus]